MHRKDFIIKAGLTALFAKTALISSLANAANVGLQTTVDPSTFPPVHPNVSRKFSDLLTWLIENGWAESIKKVSGIDLLKADPFQDDLYAKFNPMLNAVEGCEDFAGIRLIEPGRPELSLLYHLLASPLVRPFDEKNLDKYPALEQLDSVEDFIYALQRITLRELGSDVVMAVFAYEYRPACKTPHQHHADMVFSRTGFARIGNKKMAAFDRVNRCFTNRPDTGPEKDIAVTPARYGLFLAQAVYFDDSGNDKIDVMPPPDYVIKSDTKKRYKFLLPLRKVFVDDHYLLGSEIIFGEAHINEKLAKLVEDPAVKLPSGISFNTKVAPFLRQSNSNTKNNKLTASSDTQMVVLTQSGSSVLLSSYPQELVREAKQENNGSTQRLRIKIPEATKQNFLHSTNRRYTTFKVISNNNQNRDALDAIQVKLFLSHVDVVTNYHAPRNVPMFVNIRDKVNESDGSQQAYLSPNMKFLKESTDNAYWVGLFEDSICDGCVTADFSANDPTKAVNPEIAAVGQKIAALKHLPAFSVVTAPDFFPLIDSMDLLQHEKLFLVGGVEDMGGANMRANPGIHIPADERRSAFPIDYSVSDVEQQVSRSIVRVVSKAKSGGYERTDEQIIQQRLSLKRSNFLPDSATRIFYPAWDITYSGEEGKGKPRFFATYGLGSPFVEDSKLCAAVNGMWAAASPDAARTFRNSLGTVPTGLRKALLPPTAIPLLDAEIGLHPDSCAVQQHACMPTTGWDGEEGPFIFKDADGKVKVNFTDINRADYVQNAIKGLFDMSRMRDLTTDEIDFRMSCLERCNSEVSADLRAHYWLVGLEKVKEWGRGATGFCIPKDLYTNSNNWATASRLTKGGSGYLFLFVKTVGKYKWIAGSKRNKQVCEKIVVCQVNRTEIKTCMLRDFKNWTPIWM